MKFIKDNRRVWILLLIAILLGIILYGYKNRGSEGRPLLNRYQNEFFTINHPLSTYVVDVLEPARESNPLWLEETVAYIRIDKSNLSHGGSYGVIRVTTLDTQGAIENVKYAKSLWEREYYLVAVKPTKFGEYEGVEMDYDVEKVGIDSLEHYKYVILEEDGYTYIIGYETDDQFKGEFLEYINFRIN